MTFLIPHAAPSKAFAECWHAACSHINKELQRVSRPWPAGWLVQSQSKPSISGAFFFQIAQSIVLRSH
jgi:hypothetical protein